MATGKETTGKQATGKETTGKQQDVANHLITLDANVDISRIEVVYSVLDEALLRDDNIDIDASAVERVDTAGFQTLVSFCQAIEKTGRKAFLVGASDSFMTNARLLGLIPYLPVAKGG